MRAGGEYIDITNQLDSITIYEDIYSPFITGYLSVTDTLDIPGSFGRSGRDLLKLKIYTPSIDTKSHLSGYFTIYKMGERTAIKDRMQGYNLYFASTEYMFDVMKTISKPFSGTPSDIATNIVETQLASTKKINVEKTSNSISYVSNFWSPTKNLTYLASHALNARQGANYMFYENRDGLNFRSIESVSDEAVIQNFSGNDFITDTNTTDGATRFGTAKRDPIQDYKVVQKIRIDTTFDFVRDFRNGMLKTKLYSHDLVTKRLDVKFLNLLEDGLPRLNKNQLYTKDVVDQMEPMLMNMSRHYGVLGNADMTDYKWKQRRIMQLGQFRSSIVEIEVFGRTDYTVGKKVNLNLNKLMDIQMTDQLDDYLDKVNSGNYIITAIAHKITRGSHMCNIELAKSHTDTP